MPRVLEIDPTGARAADLAENLETLNERQRGELGGDLVLSPQEPQTQWAGILALALTEVGEAGVRAALFGSSVDHAEGVFLDALGSLLRIPRVVATRSRVTATLTGVAGTGVLAGSRAKTEPGGAEFQTVANVVLSPSGVTVEMEAVETGPVAAPSGSLTEIVTVVAGWETVTNAAAAAVGVARQKDEPYRRSLLVRTARSAIGPVSALEAALDEARGGKLRVVENRTGSSLAVQEWPLLPNSILAVAEEGSDGDLRRAVENHRGMGVATNTAILGGAPDDTALDAVTNGTVTWGGTAYTGLDLSSAATPAEKATALTTLLAGTGVSVFYSLGRYLALFPWIPTASPAFAQGSVEEDFGLDPAAASYPSGPFVRPRSRALTVSLNLARVDGFPGDGLDQVRTAVTQVPAGYGIGEQVWANDLLRAAEGVPGTRITALSVQAGGVDVSGVDVPLDNLWSLSLADLAITVT